MDELFSKFAPADRASQKKIESQVKLLAKTRLLPQLYNSINEIVIVLNSNRQIVFANENFLSLLKIKSTDTVYGKRPGEALGCIHALDEGGCGTTEFCRVCGAVKAIMESQQGKDDTEECRIVNQKLGGDFDLLVKAMPLVVRQQKFTVFTIKDISNEKRRLALERIFFHDVLNTATCLQVASGLLGKQNKDRNKVKEMIVRGVNELISNISSQSMLSAAENNDLKITPVKINSKEIVDELLDVYGSFAKEKSVRLSLDKKIIHLDFQTDKNVILRVLGNMVKNAIEACPPDKQVLIGIKNSDDKIKFWVLNPAFMPRRVQLQVFQRSFSTKSANRGLGTYSMKLLSERYLKGKITFTSDAKNGTTFTASYPLTLL